MLQVGATGKKPTNQPTNQPTNEVFAVFLEMKTQDSRRQPLRRQDGSLIFKCLLFQAREWPISLQCCQVERAQCLRKICRSYDNKV
jgi:hypothetical protein